MENTLQEVELRLTKAIADFDGNSDGVRMVIDKVLNQAYKDGLLHAKHAWDYINDDTITIMLRPEIHTFDVVALTT